MNVANAIWRKKITRQKQPRKTISIDSCLFTFLRIQRTINMVSDFLALLETLSIVLLIVLIGLYCVCCLFSSCIEKKHREGVVVTIPQDPQHPYPMWDPYLPQRISGSRINTGNGYSSQQQMIISAQPSSVSSQQQILTPITVSSMDLIDPPPPYSA